jgi:hypothetical protein
MLQASGCNRYYVRAVVLSVKKRQFFRRFFWRKYLHNHNIGPRPTGIGGTRKWMPLIRGIYQEVRILIGIY